MDDNEVAERFGTPAYVYRLPRLRQAHTALRAVLPKPSSLYYSVKANPHPDIVRALVGHGCRTEVSSSGELDTALSAGASPRDSLYTGPGKVAHEIRHALSRGVRRFSVESEAELLMIDDIARAAATTVDCLLRVNNSHDAGSGLRMTGQPSQFGIDLAQLIALPQLCRFQRSARVVGLHFFALSNATDMAALVTAFTAAVKAAARLRDECGLSVRELDLGGGFAAPYAQPGVTPRYDGLDERLESLLDEHFPDWRTGRPEIAFESGRSLVAGCGRLLCAITDVKRSGDRTFAVLESGINHLGGLAGLGRLLTPSVRPDLVGEPDVRMTADLVGPLCTPADVWSRAVSLPDLRAGALLAVPNVGAYGLTASLLSFLSRPSPVEVVLDDTQVVSASVLELRRRDHAPQGEQR